MSTEEGSNGSPKGGKGIGISEAKKNLRGSFRGTKKGPSPLRGSPRTAKAGGYRHGSPGGSFIGRPGSPRTKLSSKGGSPKNANMNARTMKKGMPSATKIEESLRKMESDAQEGKLKEGYKNMSFKK
mmetsp:Transcript_8621/g.7641  ORF Transcript_8621/g.7641 Transcript_8621/m.7641 type:complete len:127 (-) Transcript_8621:7-387(-)